MRQVLVAVLGACSYTPHAGAVVGDDDAGTDASTVAIDTAPGLDGTPDMPCFGAAGWTICLTAAPSGTTSLTGLFDTDVDSRCLFEQPPVWKSQNQPDACVVAAQTITVQDLSVVGVRPLVLLAGGDVDLGGVLDVASHRTTGKIGPGGTPAECGFAASPTGGSGGGAGGTFGSRGGDGGTGDAGGSAGGVATALGDKPATLRSGCTGQRGSGVSGPAGSGGGAVYLVAGARIDGASAIVDASGAGGSPGGVETGGSGGGSGGMIVLYAPAITVGSLVANGGGGASGGPKLGGTGQAGNDGDCYAPLEPASGGAPGGGRGGNGFAAGHDASPGSGAANRIGGGGGGGGGGVILSNVAIPATIASPAVQNL